MVTLPLIAALAGMMCQSRTSFEVVSVKFHPEPITISLDARPEGNSVRATANTLKDLITVAHGVKYDQISGAPSWAENSHYDLVAKAPGDSAVTRPEMRQMLQTMLADRFGLVFHRETRVVPSFDLIVDKGGSKLKESDPNEKGKNSVRAGASAVHVELQNGAIAALATQLSGSAGRPVIDKTGLTGHYAIKVDWTTSDVAGDLPDVFTAVKQLGLKLEPSKTSVEFIVIDRVEKPSEN